MTDAPQLDSAAAVEVAAFCWPGIRWESWGAGVARDADKKLDYFGFEDFASLHRAAAVLVGRGFGLEFYSKLAPAVGSFVGDGKADMVSKIAAAPSDAWARAILATVREVAK